VYYNLEILPIQVSKNNVVFSNSNLSKSWGCLFISSSAHATDDECIVSDTVQSLAANKEQLERPILS